MMIFIKENERRRRFNTRQKWLMDANFLKGKANFHELSEIGIKSMAGMLDTFLVYADWYQCITGCQLVGCFAINFPVWSNSLPKGKGRRSCSTDTRLLIHISICMHMYHFGYAPVDACSSQDSCVVHRRCHTWVLWRASKRGKMFLGAVLPLIFSTAFVIGT